MHKRQGQRSDLKRKLEVGINIQMPAPRRIGKTWTINRLATDLREDGWIAIEIDVQGLSEPDKFASNLCERIESQMPSQERFLTHMRQRFTTLIRGDWGDNPLDAIGKVDPVSFIETLISALNEEDSKCVIIIDEVSYFFLELATRDAETAKAFAYKLRGLQNRFNKVRWLLTGSIGLDIIARRFGLEGAFVDFEVYVLEPFSPEEARSFMRDRAIQDSFNHRFDASDDDFDFMFEELGWLAPYYLRLVANEVRPSQKAIGTNLPHATRQDVKNAFERLLQPNRRSDFAVWREHIDKNLPENDKHIARSVLCALCQANDGETFDTLYAKTIQSLGATTKPQLRDALGILVNDGLLMKENDRYRFRSGLVRRYWKEYEAE